MEKILPKILIISFTNLERDPRVNRQIRILSNLYDVTAAGYANPKIPGVAYIHLKESPKSFLGKAFAASQLLMRNFESKYWSDPVIVEALKALAKENFDVILANDIETLPLALKLAKTHSKIIFDAHEYAPKEYEDLWQWRLFYQKYKTYLCRTYIPQVDAMLTVSLGIAKEYASHFGIVPKVMTNAPSFVDLQPSFTNDKLVRMVWHGGVEPSRKLETMIGMFDYLDPRFELDIYAINQTPYVEKIKNLAKKYPKIRFCDPVPMRELPAKTNCYDLGLYLLPPLNFNAKYALPNKLFEFIQARLCVAIGPSPEMANIVNKYQCGVVAEDFSSENLAKKLNLLTSTDLQNFKNNTQLAAKELCAEVNEKILLQVVKDVL